MSNNSDENRLQNRLENLFSDLDHPTDIPGFSVDDNPRGWIWEINQEGILSASSPEIEAILGYPKDEVVGKPLSEFSNFVMAQAGLEEAQASVNYPVHIDITFTSSSGDDIDFHVQVFARDDEDGNLLGWRGIALRLDGYQAEEIQEQTADQESALVASLSSMLDFEDIPTPDTGSLPSLEDLEPPPPSVETPAPPSQEAIEEIEPIVAADTPGMLPAEEEEETTPAHDMVHAVEDKFASDLGDEEPELEAPVDLPPTSSADRTQEPAEEVFPISEDREPEVSPETSDTYTPEFVPTEEEADLVGETPEDREEVATPPLELDSFQDTSSSIHTAPLHGESFEEVESMDSSDTVAAPEEPVPPEEKPDRPVIEIPKTSPLRYRDEEFISDLVQDKAQEIEEPEGIEGDETAEPSEIQYPQMVSPAQTAELNLDEEYFAELDALHQAAEAHQGEPEAEEEEKEPSPGVDSTPQPSPIETAPLIFTEFEEAQLIDQILNNPDGTDLLDIIAGDQDRAWSEDELLLVQQVTDQLTLAMENANLFQQTQSALAETDEQARRLRLLNEMSEQLSQANTLQEVYDLALEKTLQIFMADRVSLALMTPSKDAVRIVSSIGDKGTLSVGTTLELEGTANKTAIDENKIIINPNTDQSSLGGIQSFILAPVSVANEILGTLNVGSFTPNQFSHADETFIAQLLSLLGSIIENRRLFDAIEEALATTEEQARRLAQLNLLSEQLSQMNSFEEVVEATLANMDKIIPADLCTVSIYNPAMENFKVYAQRGTGAISPESADLPIENSLIGFAMQENRLRSENNLAESSYIDARSLSETGIRSLIVAPLSTGGNPIGTINVGKNEAFSYSSQDENLMLSISSLVASTIDNRQLLTQIRKRSTQLETSAEVSRIASTILDTSELFPKVVELIREGFDLYYVGLFLVDETGEWTGELNRWAVLRAGTGEAGQEMLMTNHRLELGGDSMIGTAIANSEARIALDVGKEARFFRNPYLPDTRSEMALPLISRGQALGALSIQSEREAAFSDEDITALQTMADQVANAIENARLFEQTETRAEELTILNEMARAYTQSFDVSQIIELTYNFVDRLMDVPNFYLALYDSREQIVDFKLFVENGETIPAPKPKVKLGDGLADWIIKNRLPIHIPNNLEGHLWDMGIQSKGERAKSWLGVPMLRGDQVLGVIAIQNYEKENAFSSHDLDLLSAVASQSTVAIDNARRFQESQARARYEQLLREITARVHSSTDAETILRTAVREVSTALRRRAFIELKGAREGNGSPPVNPLDTESLPPLDSFRPGEDPPTENQPHPPSEDTTDSSVQD